MIPLQSKIVLCTFSKMKKSILFPSHSRFQAQLISCIVLDDHQVDVAC